jgi:hypothetical protein
MIIVGLDLATNSAVCWGRPNTIPHFRHWKLGGTRAERCLTFLHEFRALLDNIIREAEGDEVFVYIEAPIEPAGLKRKGGYGIDGTTILMLNGLIVLAEVVAQSRNVASYLVKRQTALVHFTGKAAYKRQKKTRKLQRDLFSSVTPRKQRVESLTPLASDDPSKIACMARCKQLKWPAQTYDEADAAAIWDLACAQQSKAAQTVRRLIERPHMGK